MSKKLNKISAGLFLLALFSVSGLHSGEAPPPDPPGLLRNIALTWEKDSFDVKIVFGPYKGHRLFELFYPPRLVIDLVQIEDIETGRQFPVGHHGIQALRVGQFKSDTARVVFDLIDRVPAYQVELIPEGLRVFFPGEKQEESKNAEPETAGPENLPTPMKKEEEKPAQTMTIEELEKRAKFEKDIKEAVSRINKSLEETKKTLDQVLGVLESSPQVAPSPTRNFFRVEAIISRFRPERDDLKRVFNKGMMIGAEMSIGIWDMMELWALAQSFNKSVFDSSSGGERTVRLLPFEAGLKFRLNKGKVNPYFGLGAGYYQYREIVSSGEFREKSSGFIGQAGCFIKMGGYFILDVYAHYSYSGGKAEAAKFRMNGLHFGLGLGFEY